MDNSFSQLVDSSSSVLILLPTKPYFDQVAAGLSLYLSLKDRKEVEIACASPMMVGFNRLIGVNKIATEIGNKNLVIKFAGYDATNIEKVSYDIDNGEFKLTVIPKTGFSAPEKDQIDTNYSGLTAELVILIGGANDSHFPILNSPDFNATKIAHIGTRVLTTSKEVMSLSRAGSSTSEIIATLIKENELSIDPDIATNLVMGIEEGSNHFESNEVRPETFEIFAYLLRNGGRREPKNRLTSANFPPGSIPGVIGSPAPKPSMASEMQTPDPEGTLEKEQDINPPDDWLQPKVFKGANQPTQPVTFSENKG
jgi:hypothetical protein